MMRKKAEVEADLFVLQSQKEATAASAEAAIYEAAADIEDGNIDELDHETNLVCTQRTKEYSETYKYIQSIFRNIQWNSISFLKLQFYSHQ